MLSVSRGGQGAGQTFFYLRNCCDSKVGMNNKETQVQPIIDPRFKRLYELEREIEVWGSHNSQSNPGAVMELRSMRKELAALKKDLGLTM